jgi:uncharacterized protein YacL
MVALAAARTAMTVVVFGVFAVVVVALVAMFTVSDEADVATIATAALGVIGTVVGAFFGLRIGTEQTTTALAQTGVAMDGLRTEAAKAQAFAGHLAPGTFGGALADAQTLAGMAEPVGVPESNDSG